MKSIFFWGRVLPERAHVDMKRFEVNLHADPSYNLNAKMTLDIHVSQVFASIVGDWTMDTELLKNSIESIIRERLDAFGYVTARGYDLELTGVRDANGDTGVYGVEVTSLTADNSARQLTFDQVTNALLVRQPYLRHVLADLRQAIRDPGDTAFLCYRAIETIKTFFCNVGTEVLDDGAGWKLMRESLRVDKDFILRRLKDAADPGRHGSPGPAIAEDRVSQLMAARAIVDRFCTYLNQNCTALTEADFPLLRK